MKWAVGLGLLTGLGVAALALRLTQGFLFEVEPLDKISFAGSSLASRADLRLPGGLDSELARNPDGRRGGIARAVRSSLALPQSDFS